MSETKAYKAVCPRCQGESIAEVNTLIGYAAAYRVLQKSHRRESKTG